MELTLLSGHEGRWTGYRLEPIIKETAVIWDEEIRQFSADASRPIDGLELIVKPPLELDDKGPIELVVAGDLDEDDRLLMVESIEGHELVRPFVFDTANAVRLQNGTGKSASRREISKTLGPQGESAKHLNAQHKRSFLRISSFTGPAILVWFYQDGYGGWQKAIAQAAEDKKREQEAKRAAEIAQRKRDLHDAGTAFINPYTFVPLPDRIERSAPKLHHGDPSLLIGSVELTYELLTDLVLPCDWPKTEPPQCIALPGSGIRGAVRALHEVIAGGCLRVIDLHHRPVHRETTEDAKSRQVLAVVTRVDGNQHMTEIQLTDEPIWVPFTSLTVRGGLELRSGTRFTVAAPPLARENRNHGNRLESTAPLTINPDPQGDWLLHLSDTGARGKHPYWVPIAKLTNSTVRITPEIRREFSEACLRAQGVDGRLAETAPAWTSDNWPSEVVHSQKDGCIGLRRKVDGRLGEGDSVWWVESEKRLKMALMWRKHGVGSVGDRMASSLHPCEDPASLCPTCAVFGAAGPGSGEDREGRRDGSHLAYGGHVRFLPAVSTQPVQITEVSLAPLREPRPGSGGFYLQTTASEKQLQGERGVTKSTWGSPLDKPKLRPLAGRKFYWHGQQSGQPGASASTPRQFQRKPEITDAPRKLVPAGTRFSQRVTFDGLDQQQLGLLLCALDPQELAAVPSAEAPKGRLALHFGGGKPLGFGSVICVAKTVHAQTAADRYSSGVAAPSTAPYRCAEMAGLTADAGHFTALIHALDTEFVDADRIHYPFDPEKADFDKGMTEDEFLAAFGFFARYNGGYVRTEGSGSERRSFKYPMVPLPRAADESQYIDPKPDIERKS